MIKLQFREAFYILFLLFLVFEVIQEAIMINVLEGLFGLVNNNIISSLFAGSLLGVVLYMWGMKTESIGIIMVLFITFQGLQEVIHAFLNLDLIVIVPGSPWNDFIQHTINLFFQSAVLYMVLNIMDADINKRELDL